jgi:hypothetical protein
MHAGIVVKGTFAHALNLQCLRNRPDSGTLARSADLDTASFDCQVEPESRVTHELEAETVALVMG